MQGAQVAQQLVGAGGLFGLAGLLKQLGQVLAQMPPEGLLRHAELRRYAPLCLRTNNYRVLDLGPVRVGADRARPRHSVIYLPSKSSRPSLPGSWRFRSCCSFRFVFHQLRGPCLVGCYEGLENGAMTGGLAPVVLSPLSPELPVAFGVVALDALLPKFLAGLVPLFGCTLVVAPLYEAIEFVFDPLAPAYFHLTQLLPSHCPRTCGQAQGPLVLSEYCYRPRPYIGIGTQGR